MRRKLISAIILLVVFSLISSIVYLSVPIQNTNQSNGSFTGTEPQNQPAGIEAASGSPSNQSETNHNISDEKLSLNESDYPVGDIGASSSGTSQLEERVTRTVKIRSDSGIDEEKLEQINATIIDQYENLIRLNISSRNIVELKSLDSVERVYMSSDGESGSAQVSEGVGEINADSLHDEGITGSGVRVGVLSCGGFNANSEELSDSVEATETFSSDGLANNGENTHGTGVAAIVADVAPDADLYLVNHDFDRLDYSRGLDWLTSNNVDVIAYSCGWYNQPDTGDGYISEEMDEAVTEGAVSFVSAMNSAEKHYQSGFTDTDNDGWHNYEDDSEVNIIYDGSSPELESGDQVDIELQWDDWPRTSKNIDLVLYDVTDDTVAKSSAVNQQVYSEPIEEISYTVQEHGTYAVAIYSTDPVDGDTVEIERLGDGYTLERSVARGSVSSPAAGDKVAGVAAYVWDTGNRPAYSSAGPTDDGDRGVWVSGPSHVSDGVYRTSFTGTSAAAPHAAGVAALLQDSRSDLNNSETYNAIVNGADDVGNNGWNIYSGYGHLNATGALEQTNEQLNAANFNIGIQSTNAPIRAGERLEVTATVENTGDKLATKDVELSLPVSNVASITDSTSVTLDGGESQTTTLSVSTSAGDDGTPTIEVSTPDDSATRSVTINEQLNAANFNISIQSTNAPIRAGERLEVTATVENTGDKLATKDVELSLPVSNVASITDSTSVTLDGGESQTTTLSVSTSAGDDGTPTIEVSTPDDSATQGVIINAQSATVEITNVSFTPTVISGDPVSKHELTIEVSNLSADRSEDEFEIVFPEGVEVTSAQFDGIKVRDFETNNRTLSFSVNPLGGGTTNESYTFSNVTILTEPRYNS